MPTYLNRDGYLLAEIREPYTMDLFLSIIREAAKRCSQDGLRKGMMDCSLMEGSPGHYGQVHPGH